MSSRRPEEFDGIRGLLHALGARFGVNQDLEDGQNVPAIFHHSSEHIAHHGLTLGLAVPLQQNRLGHFNVAAKLLGGMPAQEQAVEEVSKDKEKWVELMMKYELGLEKPDPRRAKKSAFNIGFSYIVGGLIPLSPYFFVSSGIQGLKISAVITLICLFIFGYFKSKLTGVNRWEGAMRVMIIGAIAAGCAFAIARLIQTGHY